MLGAFKNIRMSHHPIVTENLVFWLDAGSSKSYPGTGSTWVDLSSSAKNGTLVGSPVYESTVGSIVFDASNDEVTVGNFGTFTSMTICCFLRRNGSQGNFAGIVFSRGTNVTGLNFRSTTNQLGYHWNDLAGSYNFASNLTVPDLEWCMVALSVNSSSADLYLCRSSGITKATNTMTHSSTTFDDLKIGVDESGPRRYKGNIATVNIYNRSLSESEILRNYNAISNRFPPPPPPAQEG